MATASNLKGRLSVTIGTAKNFEKCDPYFKLIVGQIFTCTRQINATSELIDWQRVASCLLTQAGAAKCIISSVIMHYHHYHPLPPPVNHHHHVSMIYT